MWMELKNIMLKETSQTKKNKYFLSYMHLFLNVVYVHRSLVVIKVGKSMVRRRPGEKRRRTRTIK